MNRTLRERLLATAGALDSQIGCGDGLAYADRGVTALMREAAAALGEQEPDGWTLQWENSITTDFTTSKQTADWYREQGFRVRAFRYTDSDVPTNSSGISSSLVGSDVLNEGESYE